MCRHRFMPLALLLMAGFWIAPARAADAVAGEKFLRFVPEGRDGGRLETAVATYKNEKGVSVDLIAAVHIADSGYYRALNKLFENYDALLYEMVKPADAGVPGAGERAQGVGLVHILQRGMKMFLDLDYQLDGIDYSRANFVHADLTAEQFNRMQEERGESIWMMMLQQMIKELLRGDQQRTAQQVDPMEILAALASPDSARQLKLILAKQFEHMDEMVAQLEGPNGSVLVSERNKAAVRVLKQQIAAGNKKLGIFYGAAHMKDMEKRLLETGFKRTGTQWRVAWDLSPRGGAAPAGGNAGKVDDRDDQVQKLQEKIERLEKRLRDLEKSRN